MARSERCIGWARPELAHRPTEQLSNERRDENQACDRQESDSEVSDVSVRRVVVI